MPPEPRAFRRILAPLAAVLCAALLAGCGSSKYTMRLEANAERVEYGRSYVILPGIMETRAEDPKFRLVAAALDSLLLARGYTKASGVDTADLGIYVEFGVKEIILSPPIPMGGFQGAPQLGFFLSPNRFGAGESMERVFSRWISLEAVDYARYKANDPKHVVWSVRVFSKGGSSSLEKAMPFFAAAMDAYIGRKADVMLEVDDKANVTEIHSSPKHHRSRFAP
ncbi:hypothetical protein [Fundidesulfovibrio soli]|uniref:hypothetical protein n=1 Tax=Fundidesulfovibrio soli TaxID=2922716 RepID=UPI001FAFC7A4|nr:hypothetical protein [Fundidesulfovibrio soli]